MHSGLSSMRWRIAIAVALFALLAILSQSFALLMAFEEKEEEFIDEVLGQQITHSIEVWRSNPEMAFPNTPDMRLFRVAGGKRPPADMPAVLHDLPIGNHEIFLDGREHHVAVRLADGARYTLIYDVEDHENRRVSLISMLFTGAFLLAAIILVGSYLLAGHLAASLERLAMRVGQGDSVNLAEPGMPDELQSLALALELSRQRQALAIERERAFAANVSHELRTPLTSIRTDAELISALPDMPEAALRRGNRIVDTVDRMHATTASLLLLARETQPRERVAVDLRALIDDLWASLLPASGRQSVTLELAVPQGSVVQGDPAFVELVVRNLLENALRFTEVGHICCSLEGHSLCVADNGPGFDEAELPLIFDRFYTGRQGGHGLGLALVQHACTASGWRPLAANGVHGAEIRIDFGESLSRSDA